MTPKKVSKKEGEEMIQICVKYHNGPTTAREREREGEEGGGEGLSSDIQLQKNWNCRYLPPRTSLKDFWRVLPLTITQPVYILILNPVEWETEESKGRASIKELQKILIN